MAIIEIYSILLYSDIVWIDRTGIFTRSKTFIWSDYLIQKLKNVISFETQLKILKPVSISSLEGILVWNLRSLLVFDDMFEYVIFTIYYMQTGLGWLVFQISPRLGTMCKTFKRTFLLHIQQQIIGNVI